MAVPTCPGCHDQVRVSHGKLVHDGNGSPYCDPDASFTDEPAEAPTGQGFLYRSDGSWPASQWVGMGEPPPPDYYLPT